MKLHRLHWLFTALRAPEGDDGSSNGGAPADDASTDGAGSVDWEAMNESVGAGADDDGEQEAVPDPSESEAPVKPPVVKPPAKKAATTGEVEEEPSEGEGEDGNVEPEPDPNAETPPEPLTPEQIAAQHAETQQKFAKWRGEQLVELETRYAIDDDTAALLQTEPELVYPKLAAQLHMDITERVVETVQRLIPQMVPQVVNAGNVEKRAHDEFYGANPDLVKHHKQVLTAGRMFREMNPKATPAEAAKQVGEMVRVAMGLPALDATKVTTKQPAAKPHRPATPGGGGGTKPAAKPAAATDWDDLSSDD